MAIISLYEPFESAGKVLSVPQDTSAMSTLDAALAWAQEGFFVLPIRRTEDSLMVFDEQNTPLLWHAAVC